MDGESFPDPGRFSLELEDTPLDAVDDAYRRFAVSHDLFNPVRARGGTVEWCTNLAAYACVAIGRWKSAESWTQGGWNTVLSRYCYAMIQPDTLSSDIADSGAIESADRRLQAISKLIQENYQTDQFKIIIDLGLEFGIIERQKMEKFVKFFRRSLPYTQFVAIPALRRSLMED